ncbi:hypothetical protein QNM97_22805 [Gordonia sp. L191]|uniref:hypothetical protein n=1 Tax=Gordonia sp. L191 TaxID=2982699 RepID=UPI0024C02EDC|nr:hypothetical protein [Gordonia sp. L191]WHU50159.1 hypothetical protein QNM97_22805 [Gordonia sp. L191]
MSQTHASPLAWLATKLNSRSRTGSPSALNTAASDCADSGDKGSLTNGEQLSPPAVCIDMHQY